MQLALLVLGLCGVVLAREAKRQEESALCTAITSNIGPLLGPCADSTTDCLSKGDLDSVQDLICPPTKANRENIYDTLVECRGQEYADTIYAGVCGSTTPPDGNDVQCGEAILTINDGSAAKETCCGDVETATTGSGSQCAEELRNLTTDVGCCTATVVFQFYFQECENGRGLAALFMANQVDQPPFCNYPLYTAGSDTSGTANIGTSIVILSFTVTLALLTVKN